MTSCEPDLRAVLFLSSPVELQTFVVDVNQRTCQYQQLLFGKIWTTTFKIERSSLGPEGWVATAVKDAA